MTSLCLCMIVRDEAEVIERCLRSVRELISYWVICDTGSSDGTQERIADLLSEIPGELHERRWVDFGHNRSQLLELAQGKADYLLLLDADWTFSCNPGALDRLTADAYLVQHRYARGPGFELHNRHLIRGDRKWWYVGVTHEYLQGEGTWTEARLQGAAITDWVDGGVGRAKRWEQDAELLSAEVERNPDDARSVFYLAQTYRDLGDAQRAIELYTRRAKMGGWEEEVFYSLYQAGTLRQRVRDWPGSVLALLEAWNYRPQRIEPLYHLALGYRERNAHHVAYLFALRGLDRPQPDDILFVEPWIYRWGMLFEYSIASYYVAGPKEALTACDRILRIHDLPPEFRAQTQRNREFCVPRKVGSAPPTLTVGDHRFAVSHGTRPPAEPPA